MPHDGRDFYDDPAVFARYTERRARDDAPNDQLEGPAFDELVGAVAGLAIVDLGCGDARWGAAVLRRGAASYSGVDASRRMLEAARERLGQRGRVEHLPLEQWTGLDEPVDLCVSRLALHYVEPVDRVLERVRASLKPSGRLVFSVEHPVLTSCDRARSADGRRGSWIVDDYFRSGPRTTHWMGGEVRKIHRTVEDWFALVRDAGFVVDGLVEARPKPVSFDDPEEYARRMRIPLFLLVSATRTPGPLTEAG